MTFSSTIAVESLKQKLKQHVKLEPVSQNTNDIQPLSCTKSDLPWYVSDCDYTLSCIS